jgi:hypothetical protein
MTQKIEKVKGFIDTLQQGFESAWIRINLSCWILIQEAKNDPKIEKSKRISCFELFSFEG